MDTNNSANQWQHDHASITPISCSGCGKVTAQPRYATFQRVYSFLIFTRRQSVEGIFCSRCAEKKAIFATCVTWIFGWWGIPLGLICSPLVIYRNMLAGNRHQLINARLVAKQARIFSQLGNIAMAQAVALDARDLVGKVNSVREKEDAAKLKNEIEGLITALGAGSQTKRLKDSWSLFRRPFYVQCLLGLTVIGAISGAFNINNIDVLVPDFKALSFEPIPSIHDKKPSDFAKPVDVPKPKPAAYLRLPTTPYGYLWPTKAGYLEGAPHMLTQGHSKVTIDNRKNSSDVYLKLYSLQGTKPASVREIYIPAGEQFTLAKVNAGSYDIRYQDLNYGTLSRSDMLSIERNYNYSMTLYAVDVGNMDVHALSAAEF